jgi:adhesin/invasin
MNVRNLSSLFVSLLTLVVLGCGGGGGGGGALPVVAADPNAPASLTVTSSAQSRLVSDPPVTITANVLKSNGSPVATGTVVNFTASGGTLAGITTTNASGNATATLTSATKGTFTVTATVTSLPAKTVQVKCIDPNAPNSVTVTGANTANISTGVVLTATVTPDGTNGTGGPGGTIANGTVVTFASLTPGATFTPATTVGGVATTTLSGITVPATVSVTASTGGVTSPSKTINFVDPASPLSIAVSGVPTTGVTNNQVPVTVTANVQQLAGGPVPAGTTVNFAVTSGTGSLSAASATTDGSGNASVTLNSTIVGNVTVTATSAPATGSNIFSFIKQPVLVTVKLATSGTLPVGKLIGGIQAIVTANPSSGLTIFPSDVTLTGVSTGSLMTPNTTNVASVNLALINTTGFGTGEFVTLTYHVANGTFPVAGNFSVTPVQVIDTLSANLPAITVVVQSVTIQ